MNDCASMLRQCLAQRCLGLLILTACWLGWLSSAAGQTSVEIVKIEEDWELVVGSPDPNTVSPQVTCTISPLGDLTSVHAMFELNHQSLPSYVAGGLQLQIWDGEFPLASRKFPNGSVMSQAGETVTWMQVMRLEEGALQFEIRHGSSSTWGSFGGQGYLKSSLATSLPNLNGYSPTVSTANSGVSYASNRVQTLTLKQVRVFTATGEVWQDNTSRSVYPAN